MAENLDFHVTDQVVGVPQPNQAETGTEKEPKSITKGQK